MSHPYKLLKLKENSISTLVACDLHTSLPRGANEAARELINPIGMPSNDYIGAKPSRIPMTSPLSIDSRRLQLSKGAERQIRRKAAGLDECFERVTRCDVTVEGPASNRSRGPVAYGVHIRVSVPGEQMVISNEGSLELDAAISEAFDAAGRCLKDYARILRDTAKAE
jgi:ribosome-associated translation inhibitor RaiA